MGFGLFKSKSVSDLSYEAALEKAEKIKDLDKALPYYMQAIGFDRPDGHAEYMLGMRYKKLMYPTGLSPQSIPHLRDKAMHWFEIAGEKGYGKAQEECVHFSLREYGGDWTRAYYWYKKGYRIQDHNCQRDRIYVLARGQGGPAVPDEAFAYCTVLMRDLRKNIQEKPHIYGDYYKKRLDTLAADLTYVFKMLTPQQQLDAFYDGVYTDMGFRDLLVYRLASQVLEGDEAAKKAMDNLESAN